MKDNRHRHIRTSLEKSLALEVGETLQRIGADDAGVPKAMAYFYDVFRRWVDPVSALPAGKKVVGINCNQVPLELILACDAAPLRLCNGSFALEQAGAEFLPARSCSLTKATVGMVSVFRESLNERLAMVVVPTTCDQKSKAIETLEDLGVDVYLLEVPPAQHTEEADYYWLNSVKKFARTLEAATRTKITRRRLSAAIRKVHRASSEFRRLSGFQRHVPPLISGREVFLVMNAFLYDDIDHWIAAVSRLNGELAIRKKEAAVTGREAPRILLTGSPPGPPGLKIPLLLEEAGVSIVADDVCTCSQLLYDAVAPGEPRMYDMLAAVADRYLKPCNCPYFSSGEDRRRRLLALAKKAGVDGVVSQAYSGCQLYQMEQRQVGAALREEGVPALFLETDYSMEDKGQVTTRIEAFVESLEARQQRG